MRTARRCGTFGRVKPLRFGVLLAPSLLGALLGGCSRKKEADAPPTDVSAASTTLVTTPAPSKQGPAATAGRLPAFPGAEGFGAFAKGGRGGKVCSVTSNKKEGPGTLGACLKLAGPRTVVFHGLTSPIIEGPLEIPHGELTIAGQTAPAGVTIKGGLVCDNVYDPNHCDDVVIRHVRFRAGNPDGLRLGGTHDVIVDHCSFAQAEDENIEITRSRNITIQYSVVAEPEGEHYKWGGVLMNYAKDTLPLEGVSIHHTVWNGVSGRLPEFSCEENGDGPGKTACSGRTLRADLVSNVLFDVSDPIWYNRCTGNNEGNECKPGPKNFFLALNLVGNVMMRRSGSDAPLVEPAMWSTPGTSVYTSDNHVYAGAKEVSSGVGTSAPKAFAGPAITPSKSSEIVALLTKSAGAFPRDPMDQRLAAYLKAPVDARARSWERDRGLRQRDALDAQSRSAAALVDSDGDGIDDGWEKNHGLDPAKDDSQVAMPTTVASVSGCTKGYTALECYLNEKADLLVK